MAFLSELGQLRPQLSTVCILLRRFEYKHNEKSWFNIILFIMLIVSLGGFWRRLWKWGGMIVFFCLFFFLVESESKAAKMATYIKPRLLHLCKQNRHFAWCVHKKCNTFCSKLNMFGRNVEKGTFVSNPNANRNAIATSHCKISILKWLLIRD